MGYGTTGKSLLTDVAGGEAALFEVLLVVILGGVELGGGGDFGDYRPAIFVAVFEFGLGGEGGSLLLGGSVKDGRPVLGADVRALAVEGGGVVVLPEGFEKVFV